MDQATNFLLRAHSLLLFLCSPLYSDWTDLCIFSPSSGASDRPLSSSSRSSCEFPSIPVGSSYPKQPGEESAHYSTDSPSSSFPRRAAAFSSSASYSSSRLGYPSPSPQGSGSPMSPMSPMYCPSGPGGYQYGYPQSNGSGYSGPTRGSEHYQSGQYSSYPGYPVYDSQGNVVQQSGYPTSYQGYKQGGYGDYAGAYYYNCPSAPSEGGPLQTSSAANSNTPLPPDFSYVGNNTHHGSSAPPDSSYSDFYAMG